MTIWKALAHVLFKEINLHPFAVCWMCFSWVPFPNSGACLEGRLRWHKPSSWLNSGAFCPIFLFIFNPVCPILPLLASKDLQTSVTKVHILWQKSSPYFWPWPPESRCCGQSRPSAIKHNLTQRTTPTGITQLLLLCWLIKTPPATQPSNNLSHAEFAVNTA